MLFRLSTFAAAGTLLAACVAPTPALAPDVTFFKSLSDVCGQAFEGELVSTDAVDADFANEKIVMHVRECSDTELRIPLHVGDNRSRTWILTRTPGGMRLKHDHRHHDGEPDAITLYGGDAVISSAQMRFAFPADEMSKTMFDAEGIPDSKQNTWVVELDSDAEIFAYQMSRPNRFFRLEFDLSEPVDTPPAPWGHE